jgi:hypothetical protein
VDKFVKESRIQVNELRNRVNEVRIQVVFWFAKDSSHGIIFILVSIWCFFDQLNSIFIKLQGNNGFLSNSEIAEAEMRKSQLFAVKENLDTSLASNYQLRSQLKKELDNVLIIRNQERRKVSQFHWKQRFNRVNNQRVSRPWINFLKHVSDAARSFLKLLQIVLCEMCSLLLIVSISLDDSR